MSGVHHGELPSKETTDTDTTGQSHNRDHFPYTLCTLLLYMWYILYILSGEYLELEQDTVLQLQEVIEQLKNVFPSEEA